MRLPEVTTHAILLDEANRKVLLIEWEDPLGQKVWSFPGGHIEVGEATKQALVREVEEETGYKIDVNDLLGVYDNIVRDDAGRLVAHIINIVWMARILSGTLDFSKDREVINAKWVLVEKAQKLKMSYTARRILHDALSTVVWRA